MTYSFLKNPRPRTFCLAPGVINAPPRSSSKLSAIQTLGLTAATPTMKEVTVMHLCS